MTDEQLWEAFTHRTLPEAAWKHETHIRVAWMHLERWPLDEAHVMMRVGIIRLNLSHGLEETPARGYHETLTRFWLRAVDAARAKTRAQSSLEFCEAHPELLDKLFPLRYYSRERLMSGHARATMVEPDIGRFAEIRQGFL